MYEDRTQNYDPENYEEYLIYDTMLMSMSYTLLNKKFSTRRYAHSPATSFIAMCRL